LLLKVKSRKWRRMEEGRCHSLDSPLEATLGLASHSLTSFSSHVDEPNTDADANAAPPISDATSTVPNAETKCSVAANITADEPLGCTAAATIETTTGTSPCSATYAECTEPMRSRFGALFQVWHEWSFHPTMPQQAICYWSKKPITTSRVAELHLWKS
jgi:hypothetical protein